MKSIKMNNTNKTQKEKNFDYNDALKTIGVTVLVTGLCFSALAMGGTVMAPALTLGVVGAIAVGGGVYLLHERLFKNEENCQK